MWIQNAGPYLGLQQLVALDLDHFHAREEQPVLP